MSVSPKVLRIEGLSVSRRGLEIEGLSTNSRHIEITSLSAGGGGSSNYEALSHKPQINSVTLIGNKTSAELHVQDAMDTITEQEIDRIIYGG